MATAQSSLAAAAQLSDEEVIARVLEGETALFEIIMRRYNQRLYRVARSILRDDGEAEDVMQDAYVRAYQHLSQFEGRSKFSTWLTRIAVHEALARLHRRRNIEELDAMIQPEQERLQATHCEPAFASPEQSASRRELALLLEEAIERLPEKYRTVFVLREIEEASTAEAAESLELTEENVKVRLHRARALLRRDLYARAGNAAADVMPFYAPRCDRVVAAVLERISRL